MEGVSMRTWLKDARGEKTQKEIAIACGISQQMYNFIENGHRRPSPELAQKLGDFLGVDWTLFFKECDCLASENV